MHINHFVFESAGTGLGPRRASARKEDRWHWKGNFGATGMFKQFPTILFGTSNGRVVSSRASVPTKFVSERFNAPMWQKETATGAGISVDSDRCTVKCDCSVFDLMVISSGRTIDTRQLGDIPSQAKSIFEKYIWIFLKLQELYMIRDNTYSPDVQ